MILQLNLVISASEMCAFIDIKRKRNTLQKEVKDNYQEWIKYKKMLTKYKMANVFNSK